MKNNNLKDKYVFQKLDVFLIIFIPIMYLINNLVIKKYSFGMANVFFVSYFNDLICPLFFLAYCNLLLSTVNKKIYKYRHLLLMMLCVGSIWEYITPLIKKNSIADLGDIFCYLIGGSLYWILLKIFYKGWNLDVTNKEN